MCQARRCQLPSAALYLARDLVGSLIASMTRFAFHFRTYRAFQRQPLQATPFINVADHSAAIVSATSDQFRAGLRGLKNPYGDGRAAERIVSRLINEPLGEKLLVKRFHDQP